MSKQVGQRKVRVDAFDKATGRAMYTDDLCGQDALVVRLVHATVAHGLVKSIDTAAAEQVEGVVKVLTCFDVPNYPFPHGGAPLVHGPPPPGCGGPAADEPPRPLLRGRGGCRGGGK